MGIQNVNDTYIYQAANSWCPRVISIYLFIYLFFNISFADNHARILQKPTKYDLAGTE